MAYQPPGYPPAGGAPMPAFAPPPAGLHAPQAAGAPSSHPPAAAGAPPAFQHLPPQPGARPFMAPPPMGAPAGFQAPPSFQPPPAAAAAGFNPAAAAPPAMNRPPPSFQPPPAFHPPPSAGAPNVPPTGMPPAGGFAPPPGSLPGRPPQFNAPPPFQPPTAGQPPQPAASAPQQPSFAPPPYGFSAPLNPLAAPPAPQQQQLGAGLPGRFAPPPPVAVPPPNLQNLQAHQGQVVFNQVQPVRPFDDGSLSPGPQAPQNGFGGLHGQPSHPQQQQQQPLSAGQAAVAQFQQQQQQMHQPPQQQFQQMQQHQQQQQQQQQPPQQQQFQDGGYNPYVQQSQPPQQQQMYNQQQQQPQYGQQPQQQQNGQNGYPNPGVQSPVGYTPGGTVKPKKVDRIDPNQIPRRVDFPSNGGQTIRYHTRSMTLPPAATADFVCVDEGNCSPRFIRLTTNNIAHESDLIDSTRLCIGAIIQPLANLGDGEEPVPVVQYAKGPLRCSKCMAYVNPFFQFVDNGNAFLCNLCGMKNDVPDDYRCNLDANGLRRDRHDRPELCRGSVEFEVGSDFVIRPIQDPVYLFVIDVSYGAVVSGLVNAAIAAVRAAIDQMALLTPNDGGENRLKVGLITYDQSVHYYSLKTGRTEPMMLVMSDVDEPFVPCPPEEICVRVAVEENRTLLHSTLDMLASVYERNKVTENLPVFGAAIQAASETLMSLGGGKILIMQSNLPQCGVGKLEHRDAINLYFTEKEKSLQIPQSAFYSTLATKCAENAITIDLFVCANGYVDLATIGVLCEKTGGAVCVYPGFNNRKDGLALQRDIFHDVTRVTGYDGIMIVRCSTGLKVAEHFGNFYHRKVQEMELASIDCDKTFGVRLEHEGKLKDKSEACIQCALLYTTQSGHRRIRVHTISVPVTSVMSNIFRFADLDAIVNLSLKQAVRQLLDATTCTDAQNALTMACIESLFVYRKFCASATSAGQLILPEPLKLLPLCTLGLIKHPLFQDGLAADERSFLFAFVNSMPCYVSVAFVCPRLFSLSNFPPAALVPDDAGRVFLPAPLTLSSESVNSGGLYLLDDGRYMYLYIGSDLPMPFLEEVFQIKGDGKSTAGQYRIRHVPNQPQHISSRINVLIGTLRKNKPNFQNLQIISRRPPANQPQNGGPSPSPTNRGWETFESLDENLFFSHLIEDAVQKPVDPKVKDKNNANARPPNSMSYVDFLCYIHKKIQAKFL